MPFLSTKRHGRIGRPNRSSKTSSARGRRSLHVESLEHRNLLAVLGGLAESGALAGAKAPEATMAVIAGPSADPTVTTGSVQGLVWHDTNGDGIRTQGEAMFYNGLLRLYDAATNKLIASTYSDSVGRYSFTNLTAGQSFFVEGVRPFGLTHSRADQGTDDSLDSDLSASTGRSAAFQLGAGQVLQIDAGLTTSATLTGRVFRDADGDGLLGVTETGVPGWTVFADENSNGLIDGDERSTRSGDDGSYTLSRLLPGVARITLVGQDSWSVAAPREFTIQPGMTVTDANLVIRNSDPDTTTGPAGSEFRANQSTTGSQGATAVATAADGSFVVVWTSPQDGSSDGIYGRRYDASGVPQGDEFRVNTQALMSQGAPAVAMAPGGGFVVAWESMAADSYGDVHAQRFDALGLPLGSEFRVNTTVAYKQASPSIAVAADGGFVVAWHSSDEYGVGDVYAQRYAADGAALGGEFRVNTFTSNDQRSPSIALSAGGEFIVAWQSYGQDGSDYGIFAQRYSADGMPVGAEFRVNAAVTGGQRSPSVAMAADGSFAVAWVAGFVYLQRYNAEGAAQGGQITVYVGAAADPAVAAGSDGGYIVVWQTEPADGKADILARRYNAAGVPQGPQFPVNTYSTDHQSRPSLAASLSNRFVVAWESVGQDGSGTGIYVQRYDATAATASVEGRIWQDTDGNELADSGDPPFTGVVVELFNARTGSIVARATTGSAGTYRFAGVAAGESYVVKVAAPGDWIPARQDQGSDDAIDSDISPLSGRSEPFQLNVGATAIIDAGFARPAQLSGRAFYDADADGLFDADEPALSDWTVFVDANQDGQLSPGERSVVTGADGAYAFAAMAPGRTDIRLLPLDSWIAPGQVVTLLPNQDLAGADLAAWTHVPNTTTKPVGPEWRVNTGINGAQNQAAIDMSADGSFVVVWASNPYRILGQRYHADGTSQDGEFQINALNQGLRGKPSVAMGTDGSFLVAWETWGQDGSEEGIFARRYPADGGEPGAEFLVNINTTGKQISPAAAISDNGESVIVWTDSSSGNSDVYAQRYDRQGAPLGSAFRVHADTVGNQSSPRVAMAADGRFAVAWTDGSGIRLQRFDATGQTLGDPLSVLPPGSGALAQPAIAMSADGDFVVTWVVTGVVPSAESSVYAQRFSASAVPQGGPFKVSTRVVSRESAPAVSIGADEDFVIAWGDLGDANVYARRFSAAVLPQGSDFRVNTYTPSSQSYPAVAAGPAGTFAMAWQSFGQDRDDSGIYAQRYGVYSEKASVSGIVWRDANDDSVRQSDEAGESGVAVELYSAATGSIVAVAKTDASGAYNFAEVPANESLELAVVATSLLVPVAAGQGGEDADSDILPATGRSAAFLPAVGAAVRLDAGLARPASLSGTVFLDLNRNGVIDTGESRLGNHVVFVDDNLDGLLTAGERSVTSASDGRYTFSGLRPGAARVALVPQGPWEAPPREVMLPAGGYLTAIDLGSRSLSQAREISPIGGEFLVNSYTTSYQQGPAIAASGDGSYVVVWQSFGQDGSDYGIYAQRYSAHGVPAGDEFRVNTYTTYTQAEAAVAMDADGNFVVTWDSGAQDGSGYGIYARRYNAMGEPLGQEFRVNTFTLNNQWTSAVAMNPDGRFVVAWSSYGQDGSSTGIYAQRYSAAGVAEGTEFRVNSYTADSQDWPAVSMSADGSFIVTWSSWRQSTGSSAWYAQRYDSAGTPVGTEFLINGSAVRFAPDGSYVVAFSGRGQTPTDTDVYIQRFDTSGAAMGDAVRVNTYTEWGQGGASLDMAPDGSFLVTWTSDNQDGSYYGVFARWYSSEGVPQGSEFQVNSHTIGNQEYPVVASGGVGRFIVAWQSTDQDGSRRGIYAQEYTPLLTIRGTSAGDSFSFSTDGAAHTVIVNGVTSTYDASEVRAIRFEGYGGDDKLILAGAADVNEFLTSDENGILFSDSTGGAYRITATGVRTVTANLGPGGVDVVAFKDGLGNDTFSISPNSIAMTYGPGSSVSVVGHESFSIDASGTGIDRAQILDGAGNDTFTASATGGTMTYGGAVTSNGTTAAAPLTIPFGIGFDVVEGRSVNGGTDTAALTGSPGNDTVEVGYQSSRISFGGATNAVATSGGFVTVSLGGGAGSDLVTATDGPGNDTFNLTPVFADLRWSDSAYRAILSAMEGVTATATTQGTGGLDTATLADSPGDDVYSGGKSLSSLTPAAGNTAVFNNRAISFEKVTVTSSTGNDTATIVDSPALDTLLMRAATGNTAATAGSVQMNYYGGVVSLQLQASAANGLFDSVTVTSTEAGIDIVNYFDSPGDDTYTGYLGRGAGAANRQSNMSGPGYNFTANGFGYVYVSPGFVTGGNDTATLNGHTGVDRYTGTPTGSSFRYANNDLQVLSVFEKTTVNGNGGLDSAVLNDSSANDRLDASPTQTRLQRIGGGGYDHTVNGFNVVYAYGTAGGTDEAYILDSAGNDRITIGSGATVASAGTAITYGDGKVVSASGFEKVEATATTGVDTAFLYDSPGNDVYTAMNGTNEATMLPQAGTAYSRRAVGFDKYYAYAPFGGTDQAVLNDSAGNDTFIVGSSDRAKTPTEAILRYNTGAQAGMEFGNYMFEKVTVNGTAFTGDQDIATFYDHPGSSETFIANQTTARMYRNTPGWDNTVNGFEQVLAFGTVTPSNTVTPSDALITDIAEVTDSAGNDAVRGYAQFRNLEMQYGGDATKYIRAGSFDRAIMKMTNGGTEDIQLDDSAAIDTLTGDLDWAQMTDAVGNYLFRIEGLSGGQTAGDVVKARRIHGDADIDDTLATRDYVLELIGTWM